MGSLLIPQRELSGKLRILIDARFHLERTVDEACFWEVVDDGGAIVRAIAAAGDPTDQVVAI